VRLGIFPEVKLPNGQPVSIPQRQKSIAAALSLGEWRNNLLETITLGASMLTDLLVI
jgi:hypothetical protein